MPAYSKASAEDFYDKVGQAVKHLVDFKDDRVLAIHGALLVEGAIDDLLSDFMPKYSQCRGRSFAMKTAITRALCLIPSRLLRYADTIRDVRNDFAHGLNLKSFSDIEEKTMKAVRQNLQEMVSDGKTSSSDSQAFAGLVLNTAVAIHVYRPGVQLLNQTIRNEQFLDDLKQRAREMDPKDV